MRMLDPGADALEDAQDLLGGGARLEVGDDVLSGHQLHGDVRHGLGTRRVDPRLENLRDARVVHPSKDLGLVLEAAPGVFLGTAPVAGEAERTSRAAT
jgi:hypothetical protein